MSPTDRTATRLGPWGVHRVPRDDEVAVRIGPLELRFTQEAGEVRMALRRDPRDRPASGEEVEWTRWAPADWTGEISLTPVFPDRPLIVAPEDAFWLLAGAEARVYVRVPLSVMVEALGTDRSALATVPTFVYSDTWWGTVEEGELCHWLGTHARRRITEDLYTHHMAICPLQLVNRSEEDLHVEKIALRVAYLSLYAHEGRAIWSDETRVRYAGDFEGSRLEMSGNAPGEAPGAELLAPPRERMARGFRARTFARLRSIHGWM